jgi:hypothetical protein
MWTIQTQNKYRYRAYAAAAAIALTAASGGFSHTPLAGASGSATLSLSPSSQSVQVGSNLTINVAVNTNGSSTNAVAADITYPSNFSFVRFTDDPAFSTSPTPSNKGNTVTFSAGAPSQISGSHTVGTLTLHADIAGSGAITFSPVCTGTGSNNCSAVVYSNGKTAYNILGSVSGGTYNVTAGSGSSSSSSAPVISGVKVTDLTDSSATITWQTNLPASSAVNYGTSQKYGLVATTPGLVTSHSVTLGAPNIVKGATYYYSVTSTTAENASASSAGQQFSVSGFDVTLIIKSKNGNPTAGATVTLDGHTAKTNPLGEVTFRDIPAGTGQVVVKSGTGKTNLTVKVGKLDPTTKTYEKQRFNLVAASGSDAWIYGLIGIFALIGLMLIFRPLPPADSGNSRWTRLLPPGFRSKRPAPYVGAEPVIMQPTATPQSDTQGETAEKPEAGPPQNQT